MQFHHVVAFSDKPFAGNPAAVVLVNKPLSESDYQRLAAEFNVSETAYVNISTSGLVASDDPATPFPACLKKHDIDSADSGATLPLRWFTPTTEVSLCGHATLASAHVIFTYTSYPHDEIAFSTKSGDLVVRKLRDGSYSMRFPFNTPEDLDINALAAPISQIIHTVLGSPDLPVKEVAYNAPTKKLIVRLQDDSVDALKAISPSFSAMLAVDQGSLLADRRVTGVSVTTRTAAPHDDILKKVDFTSRYFAPWNGIDEDPVNGSSHTILGPFWAERIAGHWRSSSVPGTVMEDTDRPWKQAHLKAQQLSKRGGVLDLEVIKSCNLEGSFDPSSSYVLIGGQACVTSSGTVAE